MLPLAAREALMYAYMGLEDPTWVSRNELGGVEIRRRISILIGLSPEKVPEEVIVEPFHMGNQPGEVSI